jgi:hypothetical protein
VQQVVDRIDAFGRQNFAQAWSDSLDVLN